MNYGRFFQLDTEKSDLSRGFVIFDYIWLEDKNAQSGKTPQYPIYVVITKECIEFKGHFYEKAIANSDKKVHLHNSILQFPLSANLEVKDGLTKALAEGYDTKFPSNKNIYLRRLLTKAILNYKNEVSYSNLAVFGIIQRFNQNIVKTFPQNKFSALKEILKNLESWFFRKLILDFLFDLEHTNVFQNSPHYEHISVKLKENFFFNALAAKANFYYNRNLALSDDIRNMIGRIEEINKEIYLCSVDMNMDINSFINKSYERNNLQRRLKEKSIYVENYLNAEKQWTKAIRSPRAQTNFNDYCDEWFNDPEKEMDECMKIINLFK